MFDILFTSQIGLLSVFTIVFVFIMLAYLGWKFAKLSKQPRESIDQ